jgi:hypothetical protein
VVTDQCPNCGYMVELSPRERRSTDAEIERLEEGIRAIQAKTFNKEVQHITDQLLCPDDELAAVDKYEFAGTFSGPVMETTGYGFDLKDENPLEDITPLYKERQTMIEDDQYRPYHVAGPRHLYYHVAGARRVFWSIDGEWEHKGWLMPTVVA